MGLTLQAGARSGEGELSNFLIALSAPGAEGRDTLITPANKFTGQISIKQKQMMCLAQCYWRNGGRHSECFDVLKTISQHKYMTIKDGQ